MGRTNLEQRYNEEISKARAKLVELADVEGEILLAISLAKKFAFEKANAITEVVNKNFDSENAKEYCEELKTKFDRPVFLCNMVPQYVYNIKTGVELEKGVEIFAFSAIGQPQQFYGFLDHDFKLEGTKDYPDHYIYEQSDIDDLKKAACCRKLVTTEKDAVKIRELIGDDIEVFALKLKPDLDVKGLLDV